MSLADSLLADLDGLSDEEEEVSQPQASSSKPTMAAQPSTKGAMLPPPIPAKALNGSSLKRSSLAADLEDDDEDDGDTEMAEEEGDGVKLENGISAVGYVPEGGVRPADELEPEEVEKTDLKDVEDVGKVAKLLSGKKLSEILKVC